MGTITAFDPIHAPGGYVLMVYEYSPVARRNISPTTSGGAIATHLGYMQKKTMLILWHPLELHIEKLIVEEENNPGGLGQYNRDGQPNTTFVIDESVNLCNTEVNFIRYMPDWNVNIGDAFVDKAQTRSNYQYPTT